TAKVELYVGKGSNGTPTQMILDANTGKARVLEQQR
ncbi:MAG: hypothetical protein QOE70_2732, partial [Chthoniobacter sp.]|nr:hypothetical protein [Chthoniobacter sp.]